MSEPGEDKAPGRAEDTELRQQREQLNTAWSLRGNQDQVLWGIFGAFWPTHAILLVALFGSGKESPTRAVGIITSLAGVLVAVAWFLIQARAIGHVERLESVARSLEEKLKIKAEFRLSGKLNKPSLRARNVMQWSAVIVGLFWFVGLIYFVCFSLA